MAASSPSAMSFLAPNVEGRNANLASGNVEIVVNGAVPIERRGKGSWLGKPLRSLVNEVFRHARVECSAQPSGSVGEQGRLGRTVTESKADVVETVALFEIGFTGLLKGDRVRRREHGQRLEPLWMGRCERPRNHAAPIVSDDMERLRADGVGDSKDIVHETVWTIFSHVERSGTTGIATLVESHGSVSGRAQSFQAILPPTGELRPAVQQHDDRAALGTAQARVENEIADRKLGL